MSKKYVCIHGHFYQPPRENPWLESVEVQDSAAPYHDWNTRVNAECYASNAVARALGKSGRIVDLVNNYESISFNFGPTLLAWMEDADPQTYEAIIEADRRSAKSRSGHGNALAQPYNHMIMPLANLRDKVTQVRWGIADFVHRFGRKPEGMWLPETGVDTVTLEVLAEQGIQFTILAPHQARAVKKLGEQDAVWQDVETDTIDPSRAYVYRLPSGREITLFFYDGPVSRAVAFEGLLTDGADFTKRLLGAFGEKNRDARLVHIATDGESYGHHHRFGEMALAFAINAISEESDIQLTNYGEFLENNPPTHEVKIAERTSWSCSHGVGRWFDDCGCRVTGGSQAWRKPLRTALDWLRSEVDALFELKAGGLLPEPWEARNQYLDLVLDRSPEHVDEFLEKHARRRLDHFERVEALSLLEMQRNRLLMYTSCGWFFDDCAGIETVQILKYAGRAIQLASRFGASRLEQRFQRLLGRMMSNDTEVGNGAAIYKELVRPSIVDLRRVVSHHAITSLFEPNPSERALYCYGLKNLDWQSERYGGTQLAVGRVRVQSHITQAVEDVSFGLLHFGGHDFNCSLRGAVSVEGYSTMKEELLSAYGSQSLTDVIHAFAEHFEGRHYGLPDLFLEGRRSVLSTVTLGVLEELESSYEGFYLEHRKLFDYLMEGGFPLPDVFTRTIEFALEGRIARVLERLELEVKAPREALAQLEKLAREVEKRELELSEEALEPCFTAAIEVIADHLVPDWSSRTVSALQRTLAVAETLGVEPKLWDVQNAVISAEQQLPPGPDAPKELDTLLKQLGLELERDDAQQDESAADES